jgi:transposase
VWLWLRPPADLTPAEREAVLTLCQVHPHLKLAYQLTQSFVSMLRHRQADLLDTWLAEARSSGIAELERFGRGLEQDRSAVQAGLSLDYSNGPTEGQVNRLKLIKRMMYGRASFPLLRQRVLYAEEASEE